MLSAPSPSACKNPFADLPDDNLGSEDFALPQSELTKARDGFLQRRTLNPEVTGLGGWGGTFAFSGRARLEVEPSPPFYGGGLHLSARNF